MCFENHYLDQYTSVNRKHHRDYCEFTKLRTSPTDIRSTILGAGEQLFLHSEGLRKAKLFYIHPECNLNQTIANEKLKLTYYCMLFVCMVLQVISMCCYA